MSDTPSHDDRGLSVRLEDGKPLSKNEIEELIESLEASIDSEENQDVAPAEIVRRSTTEVLVSFKGPIPPAEVLEGYERACQGAADRVIAMAEKQSEHRMKMDQECLKANVDADADDRDKEYKLSRLGSVFAFIIAMTLIVIGGICLVMDKSLSGFASIGIAVASVGGVTYFNRKRGAPIGEKSSSGAKDESANDKKNDSAGAC